MYDFTTNQTGYPSIDKPWLRYYSGAALNAPLPECRMFDLLFKNNCNHGSDIALNYYGRKITYKELFNYIESATKAFAKLGIEAGEIVAVVMVNIPEMVYTIYALNRLGAIANMIDPRTAEHGIHEYIEESDIRVVVTIDLAYPIIKKSIQNTRVQHVITVSPADSLAKWKSLVYRFRHKAPRLESLTLAWKAFIENGREALYKEASYDKETCCIIAHTGGTTGLPKSVLLSNDNINTVTHGYRYLGIPFERKQRYFNDLPPFIMYGLCLATHTTLCYGLEVLLYPVFDSEGFPKQFIKYKPHHFSAVAEHLKRLIVDKNTRNVNLNFLISPGVGGDSVNCDLEREVNSYLKEHGCKYEVCKGYGMSELGATAVITFPGANAIGSVGVPLITNTIKVVDTDTCEELKYNQIGEIWISGPSIMMGYYKNPEATAEIIVTEEDGKRWIRTGDLGYINEDGLLFHKGRIRRIYLTAVDGQPAKIFPMLVEDTIKMSEAVSDCCVVGRLKENSSFYEGVAFVVLRNKGQSWDKVSEELKKLCKDNVPSYMQPVEYRSVEELPHTSIGKVDFRKLEEIAKIK